MTYELVLLLSANEKDITKTENYDIPYYYILVQIHTVETDVCFILRSVVKLQQLYLLLVLYLMTLSFTVNMQRR